MKTATPSVSRSANGRRARDAASSSTHAPSGQSPYPFRGATPFVFDAWYVAAWSSETTDQPMARTILGHNIVLYRRADGRPTALENRCPHRGLPLALGKVEGDNIACGYHGFTFDHLGRCRRIPSQDRVPPGIAVRTFPTVERWEWIWVWTGDPARADESLIPNSDELGFSGPPWLASIGGGFPIRARYQLFNENLMDQTHLTFLHGETIGSPEILNSPMRVDVAGRRLQMTRNTYGEQMSPFYARRFGVPVGLMDRCYMLTFIAPSFHIIHTRVAEAGTLASPIPVLFGEHMVLHAITPETPTTLHDFWAMTRTYNLSEETTVFLRQRINEVIQQDIVVLEAIEANINNARLAAEFSCAADAAALKARRIVQGLLDAEKQSGRVSTKAASLRSRAKS